MANSLILYDAHGGVLVSEDVQKASSSIRFAQGSSIITQNQLGNNVVTKGYDHRLYLAMYYQHPWLKAAIDTLVRTATNTRIEFVPRSKLSEQDPEEITIAMEFFSKQENFMFEITKILEDVLIFGDGYLYVVPDRRRKPARLRRLAPWTIHIEADSKGKVKRYVQADLTKSDSEVVHYKAHEILHIKKNDPGNELYGLSALEPLKASITADLHMLNFQKMFFQNGASMGTYITIDDATDADLERARQWIVEGYVGTENAFKPVVVGGRNIKIQSSMASHQDMHFMEGRNYFVTEILASLGVPPAKLGIMETANRSNAKEQDKSFRTETIAPLQGLVENVINDGFIRPILGLEHTVFSFSKADMRDAIEQMDLNTAAVKSGLNTINEIRNRMGYPSIKGGNTAFVMTPAGAVPVENLWYAEELQAVGEEFAATNNDGAIQNVIPSPTDDATTTTPFTSKSLLKNALSWLEHPSNDNCHVALTYLIEAGDDDPIMITAQQDLSKALEAGDNELIRKAYITRTRKFIETLLEK